MIARSAEGSWGRIRVAAIAIILSHLVGVAANGWSFAAGDPTYSPRLWLIFLALKLAGLIAGILLLWRLRLGVWLFAMSIMAGVAVALTSTGPYSMPQWAGAGALALLVLMGGGLFVRPQWHELRPLQNRP